MEGEEGPVAEMEALVGRLRLHRPAPSPYEPSEAVAPAPGAGAGELFRPRRTAVLVCLFRGAAGELRVILTKRSSSLSTHSGECRLPQFPLFSVIEFSLGTLLADSNLFWGG